MQSGGGFAATETIRRNSSAEGFAELVRQAEAEQDEKKLKNACRDMEAMFIYKMLQQMRATVPESGYLEKGPAEKIYRDMLDEEYSKIMASGSGSFGLKEMLYRQLQIKKD